MLNAMYAFPLNSSVVLAWVIIPALPPPPHLPLPVAYCYLPPSFVPTLLCLFLSALAEKSPQSVGWTSEVALVVEDDEKGKLGEENTRGGGSGEGGEWEGGGGAEGGAGAADGARATLNNEIECSIVELELERERILFELALKGL